MRDTARTWRRVRAAVVLACLAPLLALAYRAVSGDLGVNPVETITNETGIWTLRLVVATLAVTPLRWISGWHAVIRLRRVLGLFAFFYGSLHFLTYFVLDHELAFGGLWEDVVERPYITVGFTAYVLMIPLAVTSTQGWIGRLGGRRWAQLHRAIYAVAALAVLHYWWKVKVAEPAPLAYGVIVGLLLGVRAWRARARARAGVRAGAESRASGGVRVRGGAVVGARASARARRGDG